MPINARRLIEKIQMPSVRVAEEDRTDPAHSRFLHLLARDITSRPDALVPLPKTLISRIQRLTAGVAVDLDAPIEGDVVI